MDVNWSLVLKTKCQVSLGIKKIEEKTRDEEMVEKFQCKKR